MVHRSEADERPAHPLYEATKRVLDVLVAAAALVLLSPLFAVAAIGVRCSSPGPVLFRQTRVGRDGRPFTILKFRTMRVGHDDAALRALIERELRQEHGPADGSFKLQDDDRITKFGGWLRRTSIDELPQLICVLRGDMSLVGPRPALEWEHELFPEMYRRRVEVLPGITGLWQVRGRSTLGTLDMLRLDLEYLETRSLRGDIGIMFATVGVLARGDGAR